MFQSSPYWIDFSFTGITNDSKDPSVDTYRSTTLPLLKRFGVSAEGLDLKIESRGVSPEGGGEVLLSVPIVQSLNVGVFCSAIFFLTPLFLDSYIIHCCLIYRQLHGRMREWSRGLEGTLSLPVFHRNMKTQCYMQLGEYLTAYFQMSIFLLIIEWVLKLESMFFFFSRLGLCISC